jgi:N-acetylmuramoyl-L-alanine amidase
MMVGVFVAALLQAGSLPVQSTVRPGSAQTITSARVVVDAGHGGPDVGGPMRMGNKLYEKDITLQVALKLGEALKQRGVHVVYTRTKDTLIALSDRGKIANESNGDIFISIHVNAANPHWQNPAAARGFETYFLAEAKTEDARRVEQMENESAKYETPDNVTPGDPLAYILSDMQQNEHLRESSDLAEIVQKHLGQVHPGPSRGVKQAGFRVLVTAFMPAILVEIGFGTNSAEAEFLSSPSRQRSMARSISDATMEYLERYQRRVAGGAAGASGHD